MFLAAYANYAHFNIFGTFTRTRIGEIINGVDGSESFFKNFKEAQDRNQQDAIENYYKLHLYNPFSTLGGGVEFGWRFQWGRFFVDPVISFESQKGFLKRFFYTRPGRQPF
jgi:hypothetical protein